MAQVVAPGHFLRWLGVFQENGNTGSQTPKLFCWSSSFEGHLPGEGVSGSKWKNCSKAAPTTLTQLVPWQFGCDKDSHTCRRPRPGSHHRWNHAGWGGLIFCAWKNSKTSWLLLRAELQRFQILRYVLCRMFPSCHCHSLCDCGEIAHLCVTWVPMCSMRTVILAVHLGCSHSVAETNICEGGEHRFETGERRQEFTEQGQSKGMSRVRPLGK